MEERNKAKSVDLTRQKLIFLTLGLYSLFAILITLAWSGDQ
jgi:hypothetical protein